MNLGSICSASGAGACFGAVAMLEDQQTGLVAGRGT